MANILISGISGFVGSNLKNYLQRNQHIIGSLSRKRNSDYTYDTITPIDFDKYDAFVHLAGKAHDLKNTSNDQEYYIVNTELTKNLFDDFLKSACKLFIYFSSVKAVADKVDGLLREEHSYSPETVYGKSKALAEQYLLSKVIPEDKKLIVLRPCMIHGPKNKGNLNLLYTFIVKGIPYPFGKFNNRRSFLSIDNLCYIINNLIENQNIPSGIYNISDDETISTNQIVKYIANVTGNRARIVNTPKFIINLVAKIGDIIPLPINSEKKQKLTENYCVSNQKIKHFMKIDKLPLTAREGLELTIKSFTT